VTHKEKIKQLKKDVDVITLTATPIPRTLHMSLIGVRDMSVLSEAPVDRMPIQTFVTEYDEEMVRDAINRERNRGGQVYYVFNRVQGIDEITLKIQALVPDAVVSYAHGQMSERQLEQIMTDFINGEIDVLVSTTIIETGLDIPNVNTIIIHDSDRFGLSQLYQLRGRVGRSKRVAYAFLMYKRDKLLKEVAEKRLSAIREFTELGSGFKIAMKDLEIRGAGNLLGDEQHGHMEAVGYDLYCKMLNEAVEDIKGIATTGDYETLVDIDVDAYVPATYIRNESQKLDVYKRIATIMNEEELSDMTDELIDRFGEIPKTAMTLMRTAYLKSKAHDAYIMEIKGNRKDIRIKMYPQAQINPAQIPDMVKKYGSRMKFTNGEIPYFTYYFAKDEIAGTDNYLNTIERIITEINGLKV
jgi:transcription-repair coupling factor (superfamily II helicase)